MVEADLDTIYETIIIGAGPAGLTAALYTSRAGLRALIIEKELLGGELMNRDLIENYPGYPDGILGPELGSNMTRQAKNYGTEIILGEVKGIETQGNLKVVRTSRGDFWGESLIIASGTHPRKLNVPGETEFTNKGVFYCATCDGPRFANKVVAVAGGGNSGITEALFMARLASRVVVVELMPCLTATKILQERTLSNPKIEIKCGFKIESIRGDDQVRAIELSDAQTGQKSILEADGILVRIGLQANTSYLSETLPLNDQGQILVDEDMKTKVAGVFAAGDVRHNSTMQITTAVGDGAVAALSLCKYLESR